MARSFKPPTRRRREVDTDKIDAGPRKGGPGSGKPKEKREWTGGELVVLIGGPRDRSWYTLEDLKATWDAARSIGRTPADEPMLRYRPSRPVKYRENQLYDVRGKVWFYVPDLATSA